MKPWFCVLSEQRFRDIVCLPKSQRDRDITTESSTGDEWLYTQARCKGLSPATLLNKQLWSLPPD